MKMLLFLDFSYWWGSLKMMVLYRNCQNQKLKNIILWKNPFLRGWCFSLCKICTHTPDSLFSMAKMFFFEKQRFSNIWYSNWCRNCIFCSILLKFEMQPPPMSLSTWPRLQCSRGEPSARTWGICPDHRNLRIFFVFTFSTIFYEKNKTKHAPICRKNSGSNLFHSVTIFRKDWIPGLAEYVESNAQKWLLENFVQHFSPFSKFFCSVSHIYRQGKSKNACHGYI